MKAHVMIGISGSGKSTYVKKHATTDSVIINNDSVRRRLVGINPEDNLWDYYKFDKTVESQVKSEINNLINYGFQYKKDLWIDNTNLTATKNKHLKEFLEQLNYEVCFHNLNTSSNINRYLYLASISCYCKESDRFMIILQFCSTVRSVGYGYFILSVSWC